MFDKNTLRLYAVTDRAWLGGRTLASCVENAVLGGATMVQLREKNMTDEQFLDEAKVIKKITDRLNVPLIINDNVNVAVAVGADGVHVGQSDMRAVNVRERLGSGRIIGVSAHTVEEAVEAEKAGADYLGVGAVFSTSTKKDAENVSLEEMRRIAESVSIPIAAIGGISEDNAGRLAGCGLAGIAVVSCIFAKDDIFGAAKKMRVLADKL